MSTGPAVKVDALTKDYKGFVAVDHIVFEVKTGEIFGFLGPNGAGKTTTVRMLCTLTRPSSGRAWVAGCDILSEQSLVRRAIGVIFQDPSLDDRLTARENLKFHGLIYRVPKGELNRRIVEALEWMELAERADELVRNFSGGMKRRLEIARALLHTPKVLFLDEPTLGLDPQTCSRIWGRLLELRQVWNMTLFLTTHYMDEVEYCDRIAIIDHGKIIALDTPANLKAQLQGDCVILITGDNNRAAFEIRERYHLNPTVEKGGVRFEVTNGAEFIPRLIKEISVPVVSVSVHQPTLDDVFLKLTGREIRDEEASSHEKLRVQMRRMGRLWR